MPVRRLKHLVQLLVLLLVILAIVVFMLENQQSVIITFFGWPSVEISVSTCVVIALLVGMVVGPILGMAIRARRKVNRQA